MTCLGDGIAFFSLSFLKELMHLWHKKERTWQYNLKKSLIGKIESNKHM